MEFLKYSSQHLPAAQPGAGRRSSLRRKVRRAEEGRRSLHRRLQHQHGDAVSSKQIADSAKFTAGLSLIVDGWSSVSRQPLAKPSPAE